MNGTIGCIGLIGIAVFIVLLALWSRKSRKGVREFYAQHALFAADDAPQNVQEAIGIKDPMVLKGNVRANSGREVPFYWWEWTSSSMFFSGNSVQGSISCFLAISFPPNMVSVEFEKNAVAEKDKPKSLPQKLKDIYALNTNKPIRIEKLADGSFVIFWQVLQRPKVMEDKIIWLKNNL